jgi:hypothetical protein
MRRLEEYQRMKHPMKGRRTMLAWSFAREDLYSRGWKQSRRAY